MVQVFAMMLLLSCPDSMQGCTELPSLAQSYASIEACESDFPRAMGKASRTAPLVIAKCFDIDANNTGIPTVAWSFDENSQLNATVIYTDPVAPTRELELTMNDIEISKTARLR